MKIPLLSEQNEALERSNREFGVIADIHDMERWRKTRNQIVKNFDSRRDREFPGWREKCRLTRSSRPTRTDNGTDRVISILEGRES